MRIDNVGPVSSFSAVSNEKPAKSVESGQKAATSDRLDFSGKTSVDEIDAKIKENIIKLEKNRPGEEKLLEIKLKISQKQYYADTDSIVNSILKL
jgi:anti-sigma28 factor (negative regulator of flagellin synthesis)